jgi:hypothetical protein
VSTFSHMDWTVICDHPGCMAQARTDTLDLWDGNAASVRKALKQRGWAVAVRDPCGPVDRHPRLDFCPDHKSPS